MAQLGSCDYYGIPHEYSAMTCKHWRPAAPAPQAEGIIEKRAKEIQESMRRGAAPAETARRAKCKHCGEAIYTYTGEFWYHESSSGGKCQATFAQPGGVAGTAGIFRPPDSFNKHQEGNEETAGEMTAERALDDILRQVVCDCGNYRHHGVSWMPEGSGEGLSVAKGILDAFAKQRVEQAERQNQTNAGIIKAAFERENALAAKVADLERERDTLKTAVNQELYDLRTKWNDAESELREMREAAEKLVTKLRRIFDSEEYKGIFTIAHIHGCKYDGENCGEELTAMTRLLTRKAGS